MLTKGRSNRFRGSKRMNSQSEEAFSGMSGRDGAGAGALLPQVSLVPRRISVNPVTCK